MDPLPIDPNVREIGLGLVAVVIVWGLAQLLKAAGNGALSFRWGRRRDNKPDEGE